MNLQLCRRASVAGIGSSTNIPTPSSAIGSPDPSEPNRHPFKTLPTNNLPECPQLLIARWMGPALFLARLSLYGVSFSTF